MWNFLQRLFNRNKKDNNYMSEQQNVKDSLAPNTVRKHKLEIQVYEADYENADANNGKPVWRPVNYGKDNGKPLIIEVANKAEFDEIRKQYSLADQRIKVVREIDPFDDNPKPISTPQVLPTQQTIPQNNQAIPTNVPPIAVTTPVQQVVQHQVVQQVIEQPISKPKIVRLGDIELKYDGDKVYQKQWIKLSSSESNNFRVVNTATNKIINLNGKHIEAKRWVLVEQHNELSEDENIENLIKGQ